jgi:N-acetylneuraminate lyase
MDYVTKFGGIITALVTPYDKAGAVNDASLRKQVSRCIDRGVAGFYVCGSTAEAFLLSDQERKRILETVIDENRGRKVIIAHVGAISTEKSIEFASHARKAGADAISSVPPFYYNFTKEEVMSHYLTLTQRSEMPLFLYNIPSYANFVITPEIVTWLRHQESRIIGLKHTSMNLFDLEQIVTNEKDFVVLAGRDEALAGALIMGAHGAVGSTYNLMPEIFTELFDRFRKGEIDKVQNLQSRANQFIKLMNGDSGLPVLKCALEQVGIECNGCRKPLRSVTEEEKAAISKTIKVIGIY